MATLDKRGKNSYRLRWCENGIRGRESFKAFSYEEALERKKKKELELKSAKKSRLRLNDLWELYKKARPRRGNIPHEEAYWQRIDQFFNNSYVYEVNKGSLNNYKNWLLQQRNKNYKKKKELLSPSYVNTCLKRFQAVWNYGRDEGLIDKDNDIFDEFKFPPEAKRDFTISKNEFLHLYDFVKKRNPLYAEFIKLLIQTGWRRSELYNLKWADIGDKHITLRKTKSHGLDDQFQSFSFVIENLNDIYNLQKKHIEYVWADENGNRLTKGTITRAISRFMSEAGFEDGVAHTLRHSFATNSVANGATMAEVKMLLRHSSTRMTERYTHLVPDYIDENKINFLKPDEHIILMNGVKNNVKPNPYTDGYIVEAIK